MTNEKTQKINPVDQALLDTMEVLRQRDQRLEKLLPEGVDRSRFNEEIRFALAQTPALLSCTRASLVLAVMRAARTGLPPDGAGGMAYIIPYAKEATFVPGYKGLIFLAKMTQLVLDMQPVLVHERDTFEVEEGDSPKVTHKPFIPRKADDKAGDVLAAYTRVLLPGGHVVVKGLLYLPDLARLEASSRAKNGPRQGPHRERMQMKDSVKAAFQHLGVPGGDAFKRLRLALAADTAAETGETPEELRALEEARQESANERLRKRLGEEETTANDKWREKVGEQLKDWAAGASEPSDEEKAEILRMEMEAAKQ